MMRIVKLILEGYSRLSLRNIRYFEYTPTAKTQSILGSNGSGKSSIIKELSPLPANKNDYLVPGKKTIHIRHKDSDYELISEFTSTGALYHFKVDGENHNPGYNITTYRELVAEHFGYFQDLHDLLTGVTRFTRMSSSERRTWMLRLSDADYTYALRYFKKLSEQSRDVQGSIQRNQKRLAIEIENLLSPEKELKLRETVASLTQIQNELLELKQTRPVIDDTDPTSVIFECYHAIERLLRSSDGITRYGSADDLSTAVYRYNAEIDILTDQIRASNQVLKDLLGRRETAKQSGSTSADEIASSLAEINAELKEIDNAVKRTEGLHPANPENARAALLTIREMLEHIALSLKDIDRKSPTPDEVAKKTQQLIKIEAFIQESQKAADDVFREIQDMDQARQKDAIECPSCRYRWVANFSEREFANKKALHSAAVTMIASKKEQRDLLQAWLKNAETFFGLIRQFQMLEAQFPNLSFFFSYIAREGILRDEPMRMTMMVDMLVADFIKLERKQQLEAKVNEINRLVAAISAAKQEDTSRLDTIIQEEEDKLHRLQERHREVLLLSKEAGFYQSVYRQILEYRDQFELAIKQRNTRLNNIVKDRCLATLDEFIQSIRRQLSEYEQMLSKVTFDKSQVEKLNAVIAEETDLLRIYKVAIKTLSPTEGLIAKAMSTFINHFGQKNNQFIESIWSYPFELVPIDMNDEAGFELDYKFSLRIDGKPGPSDISQASTAQREIIDLSFVTIVMMYLGLTDFPLFLDEFAASMDHAHRQSAYRTIENLVDDPRYSQIFLVSHYEQCYGGLTNQQILVVCPENIVVPPNAVINQHVIIR